MADATGEAKEPLRVAFDRHLKLEFHGVRITSDGGLLAYRKLEDALGLTTMGLSALAEGRCGKNIRHRLLGLLRQAIYGRSQEENHMCRKRISGSRVRRGSGCSHRSRAALSRGSDRPRALGVRKLIDETSVLRRQCRLLISWRLPGHGGLRGLAWRQLHARQRRRH